jgi:hypothetical protein
MSIDRELSDKLLAPFDRDDIKWRVQQAGMSAAGKPWAMVIPYVSNRAIQARLDDVFGVMGWENSYQPTVDGKGFLCGITVHYNEKKVTKWDGAGITQIEALKGGLSDSMKRAAVQLGIGRYLYNLEAHFADCTVVNNRRDANKCHAHRDKSSGVITLISWTPPQLPAWALPVVSPEPFLQAIDNAEDMEGLRSAFKAAYLAAKTSGITKFIEEATARKDQRKLQIESEIEQINQNKIDALEKKLDQKIKPLYQMPNEATLTPNKAIVVKWLTGTIGANHEGLDYNPLFQKIESCYQDALSKLKSKGN